MSFFIYTIIHNLFYRFSKYACVPYTIRIVIRALLYIVNQVICLVFCSNYWCNFYIYLSFMSSSVY